MKGKIVIAGVTAVALFGGGAATATAFSGGGDTGGRSGAAAAESRSVEGATPSDSQPAAATQNQEDSAASASGRAPRGSKIDAVGAIEAALKFTPGAVTSVELERERGKTFWEVEVRDEDGRERDLIVDAQSAKVSPEHEHHDHDDDHDDD
ncbi:PepSY domain-containing protein [Streptomyces sp. TP-A0874]|uniref:PepSY domain-containing protein n=1 Tax=Streptomyces sp. TP-A0874 TaxID=549819 RepID=UPI0008531418|nr:PepSY domain-containing protein [Streptomyces sp. TP-A0874]